VKIVIFGLTLSSSWGNGHATLWRGLCRSLIRDGHQIIFYERDVEYYSSHRDLAKLPGGILRLYEKWFDVADEVKSQLSDTDAAIITSYCPDSLQAAELLLEVDGPLRVFYDLDTPVTLQRLKRNEPVSYVGPRGYRDFDLVLSFTGGRALTQLQEELGAQTAIPLYGSVDPLLHRAVSPQEAFRADLSYLGTFAADRQAALEKLFIEPARQLPNARFLIGGAQYPESFPWTENIYFVRHVEPPLHPAFFSSSRLTLNLTRADMRELGHCPSGRLFEAAACAVPMISDYWEGLEEFFTPGEEIFVVENANDVVRVMEMPEEKLLRVARAAQRRVLAQHTAQHRARELLNHLELARAKRTREVADLNLGA